ncbi:hypothetical protein [Azospirillum sp. TSO35-2]|uniref:hypothetical protein n=1 Tax=Azospirillum sp. TSO35-2 TaxID=716796 RepID=UPI000D61836E|nr:hypothetical protein [Azospirillum sp. TSO35-2]PWC34074.1 hypothetical protein TSO352_27550 [Azospirillum sp. TSO35-2]
MDADYPAASDPEWLRRHPDFPAVLAFYCDSLVAPLRGQRLMMKLFGQRAPTEIAALIVMMHVTARSPGDRPTVTRIQDRLPGARQTAAFIALLRGFGIVQAERDATDGRIRYLVPGPLILDGLRDWVALHLDCHQRLAAAGLSGAELSVIGGGHAGRLRSDRAFFDAVIHQCAPWLDRSIRPLTRFPDLAWLDEHDSGLYLALTLAEQSLRLSPGGWLAAPAADLARSLGVSKSHIRNLINAMERRGLVLHDDRRQRLRLAPRFSGTIERWFCQQVSWLAAAAERADADRAIHGQSSVTLPVAMS